jgi:hypothetical protein
VLFAELRDGSCVTFGESAHPFRCHHGITESTLPESVEFRIVHPKMSDPPSDETMEPAFRIIRFGMHEIREQPAIPRRDHERESSEGCFRAPKRHNRNIVSNNAPRAPYPFTLRVSG